jgi:hypothetical protein
MSKECGDTDFAQHCLGLAREGPMPGWHPSSLVFNQQSAEVPPHSHEGFGWAFLGTRKQLFPA